ncbi:hypothetical protein LEP1GSC062_3595 [Leptospira alexanderi serovar Manhao 3 str. L 60]|uniref:Uncharacterized protein n=1 Tax=Leptospira alexanderi serovar Manhao 3 str. L 60 TaxID=1049759 RepID=V6I892_9LEPT|nr:hypothetical protein LEP1GSC062_3595 [Leptospira alexanderi serovar Manhao 3 str. L 60]
MYFPIFFRNRMDRFAVINNVGSAVENEKEFFKSRSSYF